MKEPTNLRKLFSFPVLPLVIAPIILISPLLFTGDALFWGTPSTQFMPWWKFSFETLLTGHLPLWNPMVGMGAPLLANLQSGLLYPPNWFYFVQYLLGGITWMAWGQAFVLTFHLIVAGLGMARLARGLGLNPLAQTVSGLAFGLSGYLVARAWFASINAAIAWLPWILAYCFDLALSKKGLRSVVKLSAIIGLQLLAGHAQTSWYTWILAVVWTGYWSWFRTTESNMKSLLDILKNWGLLGLSIFLGAAVVSVQLLPTAEYLFQSQRASAAEFEAAMTYSFWPWRLLGLIAPDIFGNPAHGDYWGYGNFWEDAIYIGLLPFLLALGVILKSIIGGKRKKSHADRVEFISLIRKPVKEDFAFNNSRPYKCLPFFLLVITLVSTLLAMGQNTPIYPWLYHHVPTFDMFQSPARITIGLVFSLSLLAGIGVEKWRRPESRGLYWTRLGTAGAFAVTIGAGLGWYFLRDGGADFKPTFVPAIAMAGLWGLGAGILALLAPRKDAVHQPRLWGWALVIWISADLLVSGWGLNPGIDLGFYSREPQNITNVKDMIGNGRLYLLPEDEYSIKFDVFFNFESFEPLIGWEYFRSTLLPNMNIFDRIPVVNNYDPFVPGFYAQWIEGLKAVNIHLRPDLIELMGVSVLEWAAPISENGVQFLPQGAATRLRWVPCARWVNDDQEAFDLIFNGEVNLRAEVVLTGNVPSYGQTCYIPDVTPIIVSENPNKVVIQIESQTPGWLVLSDIWYPGWKVLIDNEQVSLLRANFAFRAVAVPPGSHQVSFEYQPASFYIGALVSFLTFLGLGGYLIIRIRKQ